MATKKSKIVEVIKVSLRFIDERASNPSFDTIISNKNFQGRIFTHEHKEHSLKILKSTDIYTVGLIITRQLTGVPPKANKKMVLSPLPLEEGEGLGFANVFLLYKAKNILFYEVNKNGCFLDTFRKMLHEFSNTENIEFDLKFDSIFMRNQYDKIINMREYRQLSIDIAVPNMLIDEFKNQKDSISASICEAGKLNASRFEIVIKYDARNYYNIPSTYLKFILDKFQAILKKPEKRQFINKFEVKGYSEDSEKPNKLLPIDLLGDAFRREIKLTEIRLNSDLQENERKLEIIDLFDKSKEEIDGIFAK